MGLVVTYAPEGGDRRAQHEVAARVGIARMLATLQGFEFGGGYEPSLRRSAPLYFVPSQTLSSCWPWKGCGTTPPKRSCSPRMPSSPASALGAYLGALLTYMRPVRLLALHAPALYKDDDWELPKRKLRVDPDFAAYRRHALSQEPWERAYTGLLVGWLTERVKALALESR